MKTALHHIGLTVCDIQRATALFHNIFGFVPLESPAFGTAILGDGQLDGSIQSVVTLRTPNCSIELVQYDAASGCVPQLRQVNEAGITHFCIQSRHIQSLYDGLIDVGAQPNAPPTTLLTGTEYLYARDPEQNVIEIEGLPYAPDEQLPWLAHVAIATPDIERLAGFYHGLLGGERRGGQKIGPNPLYDQITGLQNVEVIPTWIVGANITLELWQYLHPPTLPSSQLRPLNQPGYSHLCMQVESLATAMEYIAAAGGQIVSSISKQDACSSARVRDPDGNVLELVEIPGGRGWSVSEMSDPMIVQRVEALRTKV